jgi:hypothetical protein
VLFAQLDGRFDSLILWDRKQICGQGNGVASRVAFEALEDVSGRRY